MTTTDLIVLELKRHFDAPPEQVFDAWLSKSWGEWVGPPAVCRSEVLLMEPRVGGRFRLTMHKTDGSSVTAGGVYREIARPSRIAMTWKWEHGQDETLLTLTFRAAGGGTDFTLRHEGFTTEGDRDAHNAGWSGSLDKLAPWLAGA
jgi:uncharacterized protein YndB with AHSA1/START domain